MARWSAGAALLLLGCAGAAAGPTPELSPAEVVQAQLSALKRGGEADLRAVFAYASPPNREQTGPAERFARMLREGYAPMIGHRSAELAPTFQMAEEAIQPVLLVDAEGREHRYLFLLGRYDVPGCEACWMTDGVLTPEALLPFAEGLPFPPDF